MDEMIRIQLLSDPTGGPVRDILEDQTLLDGERIELLLVILGSIWEETNGYQARQPKIARSSTRGTP